MSLIILRIIKVKILFKPTRIFSILQHGLKQGAADVLHKLNSNRWNLIIFVQSRFTYAYRKNREDENKI